MDLQGHAEAFTHVNGPFLHTTAFKDVDSQCPALVNILALADMIDSYPSGATMQTCPLS